ncbi:MAG: hypothetical protein QXQ53_01335 [Candidatus Methanosuratincola sp.]
MAESRKRKKVRREVRKVSGSVETITAIKEIVEVLTETLIKCYVVYVRSVSNDVELQEELAADFANTIRVKVLDRL